MAWSLAALQSVEAITHVVAALPPGVAAPHGVLGVGGGAQRSHSVRAALHAAPASEWVLVHDAARPMLTPAIVQACLRALGGEGCDAAIAAAPVADTIKQSAGSVVVRTLDRRNLWAIQTPQAFDGAALRAALEVDDRTLAAATDDAALLEARGGSITIVPAPAENIKVTTRADLAFAELLLAPRVER